MNIKDRIKKISPYFREMQIITTDDGSQVIYILVSFPKGWIIDDEIEKKFGITIRKRENSNEYFFCTEIETGEECLFDAIDYYIEKMQEAIERAQLFSHKTNELKALFEDETITIEELRGLRFEYHRDTINLKDVVSSKKKKKEEKEKENNLEKTESDE